MSEPAVDVLLAPSPSSRATTPAGLRAELAASIDDTLHQQARLNEMSIATIRASTLLVMACVEVWLLSGPSALGAYAPAFASWTVAYLAAAIGIWALLRWGFWSNALTFALPVADAVYMTVRVTAVFAIAGLPHASRVQELATVTAMASLLACSGAFRLDGRAVALTTGLGLAMYVLFARWLGLPLFHASVHFALIAACGATSAALTRLVARAVHSEVTRLTLRRLLPAAVIDAADADPMALLTQPRSVDATVVITDLRGFTTWAETRSPLEVLGFLNAVQGALAREVLAEGGTIDKFMGDGMLAVFGAPQPLADHADRAVRAVRGMLAAGRHFEPLALGVGVHTGEVVIGCVGSGIRMEFTVLGDTVNTASRLEAATKDHDVPVLISVTTQAACREAALTPVGVVGIRGRTESIEAFTL